MPQRCTICTHPERTAIDRALVAGEQSNRRIASQFSVTEGAVRRHKAEHVPRALVEAAQEQQHSDAVDVMHELGRALRRVNLVFDACDSWLRDPDDPTRYDIGPRASDITVVYSEPGTTGKPIQRKALLSALLARVEDESYQIERWHFKHADPRELILKTHAQLTSSLELLAKLEGKLQQEGTINITVSPQWLAIRAVIVQAVASYPEARAAVAAALSEVDHAGH